MPVHTEALQCVTGCLVGRALDGLAVGMVLTDPDGHVLWMNRSARMTLAVDDEVIVGLLSDYLKDPELRTFWRNAIESEDGLMADLSLTLPEPCELKANATKCLDEDGDTIGQALLFCDVTRERSIQVELTQAVASRLLELAGDHEEEGDTTGLLTPQETQVLKMVGDGMSNHDIADAIDISTSTVRSHLKSIYRKLGLKSRAQAVSYAIRRNIV